MKIMQKIFLILSFTLLSICALQSCDGNGHIDPDIIPGGGSTGGITRGNINGVWVPTDEPETGFYWEWCITIKSIMFPPTGTTISQFLRMASCMCQKEEHGNLEKNISLKLKKVIFM